MFDSSNWNTHKIHLLTIKFKSSENKFVQKKKKGGSNFQEIIFVLLLKRVMLDNLYSNPFYPILSHAILSILSHPILPYPIPSYYFSFLTYCVYFSNLIGVIIHCTHRWNGDLCKWRCSFASGYTKEVSSWTTWSFVNVRSLRQSDGRV